MSRVYKRQVMLSRSSSCIDFFIIQYRLFFQKGGMISGVQRLLTVHVKRLRGLLIHGA